MKTKTKTKTNTVAATIAAAVQGILQGSIKAEGIKGEAAASALRNIAAAAAAAGAMNEAAFKAQHGESIAAAVKALTFKGETVGEGKKTNTAWCLGSVFVACCNGWDIPTEVNRNFQKAAAAARDFNVKGGFAAAPNGEKGGRPKGETAASDKPVVNVANVDPDKVVSPLPSAVQTIFPGEKYKAAADALHYLIANGKRDGLAAIVLAAYNEAKPKNK